GQAHDDHKSKADGTPITEMQGAGDAFAKAAPRPATLADLEAAVAAAGGKARAPEAAAVLSRFPKKK
ncbi:MAG: hypothetical protein HYY33_00445, partial [Chloroflexi bacterium]|nr:hypothetical protein [Chloroflexota bacterium]